MLRRSFLTGLLMAPAIVRASSLDYVPRERVFRLSHRWIDAPLTLPPGYDRYEILNCKIVSGVIDAGKIDHSDTPINVTRCSIGPLEWLENYVPRPDTGTTW